MEVLLHLSILKTNYSKYLLKRQFRLRLRVSDNFGSTGSDSGKVTLIFSILFT